MKQSIIVLLLVAASPVASLGQAEVRQGRAKLPRAAVRVLDRPDSVILYSITPKKAQPGAPAFQGYEIVKEKRITDRALRDTLLLATYSAIGKQKVGARCFVPHHGVRATRGKATVDLVVCFSCQRFQLFQDGKRTDGLLSADPQTAYNSALR